MDDDNAFVHIVEERCSLCGCCVSVCTPGALNLGEGSAYLAKPEVCGGCARCEETCPEEAIYCDFEIVEEDPER